MRARVLWAIALLGVLGVSPLHASPPIATPTRAIEGTHRCTYPEDARRRNQQGSVLLKYDVNADGRMTNIYLLKSSGYKVLDRAAVHCVLQRWKNVPATRDGLNVASPNHRAKITFKLSGRSASPGALFVELLFVGIIVLAGLRLRRRKTSDPASIG